MADGEAGVEQGRDAWVLAGLAGVERGAVHAQRFAVAAVEAGLQRQIAPGAGLTALVLGEDGGLQGVRVQQPGLAALPGVVGGPPGGRAQVADRGVQGLLDPGPVRAAVGGGAQLVEVDRGDLQQGSASDGVEVRGKAADLAEGAVDVGQGESPADRGLLQAQREGDSRGGRRREECAAVHGLLLGGRAPGRRYGQTT
ncbi:hypothetical protein [Streptomyces sp. WAC00263]|uniref:hypothetical protein n=1 Tax=Streptomyces sp. WAC00263 TaxID=1917422 RepID=UPI001F50B1FE|nr:hypothetical protein [Streptomyces sp. WAC00263]